MDRSEVQPLTEAERETMDRLFTGVLDVIEGSHSSIALSVLAQAFAGNLGDGESLNDQQFLNRTLAMLAIANIFRTGPVNRECDQVSLAESVHDLVSIVKCGSRPLMIAALASVLVASVANGRRDATAEAECIASIKEALDRFDSLLGS